MTTHIQCVLAPVDNVRLANLCGEQDGNINHIADALSVTIKRRGERFQVNGNAAPIAAETLKNLYEQANTPVDQNTLRLFIARQLTGIKEQKQDAPPLPTRQKLRNAAQQKFWQRILAHPITLCHGPAGTGKTHVALLAALHLLESDITTRIILTRPVVEAGGERLGFLPGDMEQKVNPYLRPMHDILHDLLGRRNAEWRMARGEVEVMPLAFMRGVTFNNAVIILDEAQNTTPEQVKMLLTRLGENSKIIIIGDTTQSDLPNTGGACGLSDAVARLGGIRQIALHAFNKSDIVRHPLVGDILRAYE